MTDPLTPLRDTYGELRKIVRAIFFYPQKRISHDASLDYDAYWGQKRGAAVGVLSRWQKARADVIVTRLAGEEGITIADIGCGEGSILRYLKERVPGITKATGYDSSEFVLEKAKAIGVETVLLDTRAPGWEEKIIPADYGLLLETIEHLAEAEKTVAHVLAKTAKGVFVSVPNTGYFTYRLRLLFGKFPAQWIRFPNEHLRFWTYGDMKWWLRAQGYAGSISIYKGIPVLNRILPGLFGAGMVVFIPKA